MKANGRPKKETKREKHTGIRFTKLEYFVINEKAEKAGLPMTTYMREVAFNGKIAARLSDEERQFVRKLTGMSNNLNQLTILAHREGLQKLILLFEEFRTGIDGLLKYIGRD